MRARYPAWVLLCIPILVGWVVMFWGGAPAARWGLHLGAGALGLLAYLAIVRAPTKLSRTATVGAAIVGVAVVASSLLSPGISGIHRWHEVGALRIHPSALLAPALLIFAAAHIAARPLLAHLVLASVQAVHVLQPDAGQATALGAGIVIILMKGYSGRLSRVLALGYAASVAAAWMRPDPLPPAPFVEDIVARAFALAPAVGVLALLSMVPFGLAPRCAAHQLPRSVGSGVAEAEAGLTVYFIGSLVASAFGEFPVPLLGFGPSPAVGAFLGLAALQRVRASGLGGSAGGLTGPWIGRSRSG